MAKDPVSIRPAVADDLPAIVVVHDEAFGGPVEGRLVDLLHQRGKATVSLVAEVDGRIVGHILFSPVALSPERKDLRLLGLAPVGILPEHQRLGIGHQLVKEGLRLCAQDGCDAVVLFGHPEYYPRFGFRRGSEFGLGNEYGVDDPFMALEIREGALTDVKAMVVLPPEFAEAEGSGR